MSESALTVSLDQGGHSSRAIAFNIEGGIVASAQRKVSESRPAPDRVEQDPEELALSLRESLDEVCAKLGEAAERITRIGLATQRSSLVCWSAKTGRALSSVLSWQDRRAAKWLAQFERHAVRVRQITGLFLSPHYGVSKLAWCLRELPEVQLARQSGELRMGPLASFLAMRLLGTTEAPVDPCNAGRTLLFDLRDRDWSAELLELFEIPREVLPECQATHRALGMVETPIGKRPLEVLSGDQPAALYAYGKPESEAVHVNLGTGAFVLRSLSRIEDAPDRLLASVAYSNATETRYVVEGTVNGAASALDFAAGELGLSKWEDQLEHWLAAELTPPLFLNGVAGMGSPYWIPNFQSSWIGAGTPGAKMVAVAESILFLVQRNLDELSEIEPRAKYLRVTGGLSNSDALCQNLANLAGLPVERPVIREATARGVAYWLTDEPEDWPGQGLPTTFEPGPTAGLRERYAAWLVAVDERTG